jgi:uridine phosphorylase
MPARLRPTAPFAADAVLVGDPGRALLLAQELLEQPKMSNHARGLWGYSGLTPAGRELSVQSTGMGGPSAALVLADLAELGVRRAIRVGTATAVEPGFEAGELLVVVAAHAGSGSAAGTTHGPDPALTAALERELGGLARRGPVASFDAPHPPGSDPGAPGELADMQTATLLECGAALGVALAAVLIVAETAAGVLADDELLVAAATRAGKAATAALST